MTLRGLIGVLLVCAFPAAAIAQSAVGTSSSDKYVPRLGDIMSAAQARHMKLWFAGKAHNWELADYELRQLKAGLTEAALLYEGLPVDNVTTMVEPVGAVGAAIAAKDSRRFVKAFGQLTQGCNACHQSIGRGFIAMRVPETSPFGNQLFPPRGKQ